MFNIYDQKKEPRKFFWSNVLSGGLAGASGLVFVYPLDFARTRLAADVGEKVSEREFKGLMDCMIKVSQRDGPIALYKGFQLGIFGAFAFRGAYFGLFDTFRSHFKDANLLVTWSWAQFVAMFSSFYIYPNDTCRRRLMMDVGRPMEERRYKGIVHAFKTILAEEGWRAFYKGALTNALRGSGSALVLVFYD